MQPGWIDIVTGGTRGLTRDAQVASSALVAHWPTVIHVSRQRNLHLPHRRAWRRIVNDIRGDVSLSIFFEILPSAWLQVSSNLIFVPNQEWIRDEVERNLPRCRELWCKTRFAEQIFRSRGYPVRYIGFSTNDLYDPNVPKDYGRAIHVAGRSHLKGTGAILQVWSRHPEWPLLRVISRHRMYAASAASNIDVCIGDVDEKTLIREMNACGIHLCPSETEGYGHYIAEALSTKALVITVDAPPMNELVTRDFGLLAGFERIEPMSYSSRYFVGPEDLEEKIEAALRMGLEEKRRRGELARQAYLDGALAFEAELVHAVEEFAN